MKLVDYILELTEGDKDLRVKLVDRLSDDLCSLSVGDFLDFMDTNEKNDLHPETKQWIDSTLKKIKGTMEDKSPCPANDKPNN